MSICCKAIDLFTILDATRRKRQFEAIHVDKMDISFNFIIGKFKHLHPEGIAFYINFIFVRPDNKNSKPFEWLVHELEEYVTRLRQVERDKTSIPRILLFACPESSWEKFLLENEYKQDEQVIAFLPQYWKLFA